MEEDGGFSVNYEKLVCSRGNLRVPDAEVVLDRGTIVWGLRGKWRWIRMFYRMTVLWEWCLIRKMVFVVVWNYANGRKGCYKYLPGGFLGVGHVGCLCFCDKRGWQESIRFGLSSVIVRSAALFSV
ncbi:MAG: hypothetical protein K2I47_06450 [Odoribacter sp.]|nr:hypothetical protein [Odoribacter sp.]